MSTPFDYDDFAGDIDLETHTTTNDRDAWYKGIKGKIERASPVYFHRVDVNAVLAAKRENPRLSRDEQIAIGAKALKARADQLGKSVDDLTDIDKLDRGTAKFKKIRAHFQEGLGFVTSRLGLEGSDADKVWRQLPEPRVYYVTLMVFYLTDNKGQIIRDKEAFQAGLQVRPWRLSEPSYQEFEKTKNTLMTNNIPVAGQDFLLDCKDPTYQKFTVTAAGKAIWASKEDFAQLVLSKALPFYDKLSPFRDMTTEQLRQKLGGGSSTSSSSSAGALTSGGGGSAPALDAGGDATNFDDILSNV